MSENEAQETVDPLRAEYQMKLDRWESEWHYWRVDLKQSVKICLEACGPRPIDPDLTVALAQRQWDRWKNELGEDAATDKYGPRPESDEQHDAIAVHRAETGQHEVPRIYPPGTTSSLPAPAPRVARPTDPYVPGKDLKLNGAVAKQARPAPAEERDPDWFLRSRRPKEELPMHPKVGADVKDTIPGLHPVRGDDPTLPTVKRDGGAVTRPLDAVGQQVVAAEGALFGRSQTPTPPQATTTALALDDDDPSAVYTAGSRDGGSGPRLMPVVEEPQRPRFAVEADDEPSEDNADPFKDPALQAASAAFKWVPESDTRAAVLPPPREDEIPARPSVTSSPAADAPAPSAVITEVIQTVGATEPTNDRENLVPNLVRPIDRWVYVAAAAVVLVISLGGGWLIQNVRRTASQPRLNAPETPAAMAATSPRTTQQTTPPPHAATPAEAPRPIQPIARPQPAVTVTPTQPIVAPRPLLQQPMPTAQCVNMASYGSLSAETRTLYSDVCYYSDGRTEAFRCLRQPIESLASFCRATGRRCRDLDDRCLARNVRQARRHGH